MPAFHQVLTGTCIDLSYEGKGVFRSGKEVVFVEGMFPGDEGEVEILYKRAGQLFGAVKKLSKKSPGRMEPRCKICHACGGCAFQQYSYPEQLRYKTEKVKEQFRKIAHMDVTVQPCIGMDEPYFYRNKIQMPFGKSPQGKIYCGFYRQNSHVIVPVDQCFIEDPRSTKILSVIKSLCQSMHIEPYHEDDEYGILRHVLIRTSYYKKQVMVVLVTAVDSFPSRGNFVGELLKQCPEITTVVQNINSRHTNVILGEKERVLYGKGFIEDSLCGLSFRISAKSFYQTNPVITEKLYTYAMKSAKLTKDDVVFDAYSGIGTIGLIAAKDAKQVLSVELVKSAVIDGVSNAKRNHITNFQMYCDDASTFMTNMARRKEHVDVLFLDPPRKGSDERFIQSLLYLKPERVVYVSCDPSTLARDMVRICKGYKIEAIQPFDMFPQTPHVETVVLMSRFKNKIRNESDTCDAT